MKKVLLLVVLFLTLSSCLWIEEDSSRESPLPATMINKMEIEGRNTSISVTYQTGTPCWYFKKRELSNNDTLVTVKVFGKTDGETCVQILGAIENTATISFLTPGSKEFRFWVNDSTWLDTTILIR